MIRIDGTWEEYEELIKQESFEDGLERGREEGLVRGRETLSHLDLPEAEKARLLQIFEQQYLSD